MKVLFLITLALSIYPLIRCLLGIYTEKYRHNNGFLDKYMIYIYVPVVLIDLLFVIYDNL